MCIAFFPSSFSMLVFLSLLSLFRKCSSIFVITVMHVELADIKKSMNNENTLVLCVYCFWMHHAWSAAHVCCKMLNFSVKRWSWYLHNFVISVSRIVCSAMDLSRPAASHTVAQHACASFYSAHHLKPIFMDLIKFRSVFSFMDHPFNRNEATILAHHWAMCCDRSHTKRPTNDLFPMHNFYDFGFVFFPSLSSQTIVLLFEINIQTSWRQ